MFSRWREARRPSRDSRRTIEDLARSLALILEPAALRASIASRVRELIGCETVIVCAFTMKDNMFSGESPSSANGSPHTIAFAAMGPLAKWLRVNEEPLLLPHPDGAFDYLDEAERTALTSVGARACVPIFAGSRLMALLVVCATDPAWQLRTDDSELLVRLGRQAGLALQNAELQSLERERLRNVYRAEQLAVAGQLAATVAHEVRNPLTAIRSSVQFALQSAADWDTKQRLLEGVLDAVDRIDQTIGSVLALSRPDDADVGDVDLVRTVEESLLMTEAYARAHGISVVREFEVPSLIVRGNRRSLVQVCVNLFLNACQAMDNGGKATLRCAMTDPSIEPPSAVLQIRDTGPGIAPEHLAKVFDPFFTTKAGGTGLGLPICLDLVTRHAGQLRLDSTLGHGTTATILLPLHTS
jgi:signal transduction histidine kinase